MRYISVAATYAADKIVWQYKTIPIPLAYKTVENITPQVYIEQLDVPATKKAILNAFLQTFDPAKVWTEIAYTESPYQETDVLQSLLEAFAEKDFGQTKVYFAKKANKTLSESWEAADLSISWLAPLEQRRFISDRIKQLVSNMLDKLLADKPADLFFGPIKEVHVCWDSDMGSGALFVRKITVEAGGLTM